MRRFLFIVLVVALFGLIPITASAAPPGAALRLDTTAAGHLTRTFTWDIAKTANPTTLEIAVGGSADSTFNVTVTETGYTDEWSAGGDVCVSNSGKAATDSLAITAAVEHRPSSGLWLPLTTAPVDVAANPVVASGESHCYPFDVVFTPVAGADYRIVVTAAIANSQGNRTGQMETRTLFTLPDTPDGFVNDEVTVNDSNGMSWTFSETRTETYDRTFDSGGTFTNTATMAETGQTASATVTVTAGCVTDTDAVAYWCYDDQTNPTGDGADSHDGTVVGAQFTTTDVAPVAGNVAALDFNGATDYVEAVDPGGVNNLDGFSGLTLAAWINPNDVVGTKTVVSKYNTATDWITYYFILRDDEVQMLVVGQTGPLVDRAVGTAIADVEAGTWTHIAGTWDGSHLRLYVNGREEARRAFDWPHLRDSSIPVNVGAIEAFSTGDRSAFFDGLIDEVYIFDRALTRAEIRSLPGVP